MRLVTIDHATSRGQGSLNEDMAGATSQLAWMIDGSTDLPATFRPLPDATGAYWLAHTLSKRLERSTDAYCNDTLAELASYVNSELMSLEIPADALPPACSIGIARLLDSYVRAYIVGDVYVYHVGQDDLLSDPRFERSESQAVRAASQASAAEITAGMEKRRRGYIRGENDQWIFANNPEVRRGARVRSWPAWPGDHLIFATDGFARLITSYGVFPTWKAFARDIRFNGAAHMIEVLREFEAANSKDLSHFKASDDACVAIHRLVK